MFVGGYKCEEDNRSYYFYEIDDGVNFIVDFVYEIDMVVNGG